MPQPGGQLPLVFYPTQSRNFSRRTGVGFAKGRESITRECVMSHSLIGADRPTQVRVVAVAVAAATLFVAGFIGARVADPGGNMLVANSPTVVKAEKATVWTSNKADGAFR